MHIDQARQNKVILQVDRLGIAEVERLRGRKAGHDTVNAVVLDDEGLVFQGKCAGRR